MKRQKRPIQSKRLIVLILLVLSIYGIQSASKLGSPIQNESLLLTKPTETSSPSVDKENKVKVYRIVIDPGHGGKDPGGDGASGKEEKDYTLSLSQQIYGMLQQEPMFEPYLIRNDDTFFELEDRSKFANDLNADALISIHGNTYIEDPEVSGIETYYYAEESSLLAQVIHEHLVEAMGFRDREVRQEMLKVLIHSEVPAVLTEIGFLTNEKEEAAMLSSSGKTNTAQAIVEALKHYFTETLVDNS